MHVPTLFLHHTGIVVPSEEGVAELMNVMGLKEDYRGYVSQWHALCIFGAAPSGTPTEFVIADEGPLLKFNKGIGGIHHVAFAVADLDQTASQLADQGMNLLESDHVQGAGPFLCNFLSPMYTRGITIEYVQELN